MSASDSEFPREALVAHDEVDNYARSPSAENPVVDTFNIVVSVPESIEIKMVDASALADYEVWVFIASLLSNAVVGFSVAYFQAVDAKAASAPFAGWVAVMFIALFLVATITALRKRSSLRKKGRDIRLKTSGASAK